MFTCPAIAASGWTRVRLIVVPWPAACSALFAQRSYTALVPALCERAGQRAWQRGARDASDSMSAPDAVIHVPVPGSGLLTVTPGRVPAAIRFTALLPT